MQFRIGLRISATACAAALLGPAASAQDAAAAPDAGAALTARNLAATCSTCHGGRGDVAHGEIKSLSGLSAAQIRAAMADFKTGRRTSTVMQQIAKGYADEQVRLIAEYYAGGAR